jgi:hypothetical protein
VTPHLGWGTVEARARVRQQVAENLRAFVAGQRLNRVIERRENPVSSPTAFLSRTRHQSDRCHKGAQEKVMRFFSLLSQVAICGFSSSPSSRAGQKGHEPDHSFS